MNQDLFFSHKYDQIYMKWTMYTKDDSKIAQNHLTKYQLNWKVYKIVYLWRYTVQLKFVLTHPLKCTLYKRTVTMLKMIWTFFPIAFPCRFCSKWHFAVDASRIHSEQELFGLVLVCDSVSENEGWMNPHGSLFLQSNDWLTTLPRKSSLHEVSAFRVLKSACKNLLV